MDILITYNLHLDIITKTFGVPCSHVRGPWLRPPLRAPSSAHSGTGRWAAPRLVSDLTRRAAQRLLSDPGQPTAVPRTARRLMKCIKRRKSAYFAVGAPHMPTARCIRKRALRTSLPCFSPGRQSLRAQAPGSCLEIPATTATGCMGLGLFVGSGSGATHLVCLSKGRARSVRLSLPSSESGGPVSTWRPPVCGAQHGSRAGRPGSRAQRATA
jgi:hypothetical protein